MLAPHRRSPGCREAPLPSRLSASAVSSTVGALFKGLGRRSREPLEIRCRRHQVDGRAISSESRHDHIRSSSSTGRRRTARRSPSRSTRWSLPYNLSLVNIGKGDQFKAEFLAISPNNRMPAIVDPDGPDGQPISVFESGAILQYLGAQDRPLLRPQRARAGAGRGVALLAGRRRRADGGPGAPLPALRPGDGPAAGPALRPGALPATRSGGSTACWTGGWPAASMSPATIRSPTWRSGPGRWAGRTSSRTSRSSRTWRPGSSASGRARRSSAGGGGRDRPQLGPHQGPRGAAHALRHRR